MVTLSAERTPRRKVLVVEDDGDIQVIVKAILDTFYEVRCADNGQLALETVQTWQPDLILLDLAMPEMDGLTFLKHRAGMKALRTVPVICVTASRRSRDVKLASELGVEGYVTKPFNSSELLASVSGLMRGLPPG